MYLITLVSPPRLYQRQVHERGLRGATWVLSQTLGTTICVRKGVCQSHKTKWEFPLKKYTSGEPSTFQIFKLLLAVLVTLC